MPASNEDIFSGYYEWYKAKPIQDLQYLLSMLIPQYLEMFYICSSYVHSGSQFRGLETAIQEISGLEEIQS
jgi:hypothetical protein